MKTKTNYKWLIKIVFISIAASMVFALATSEILGRAAYVVAFVVLILFIAIGIIFDVIGVAVVAATEPPFHSMAAHREHGATESLRLIKNADRVSSFCNDVVGDVSGIISGSTAALIAAKLVKGMGTGNILIPLLISGAVSGLMVGGKAVGKTLAFNNSTAIIHSVGKLVNIARGISRLQPYRKRKKRKN